MSATRAKLSRRLRAARTALTGRRASLVGPPPDVPPGWVLGPPDFVGIGAQKAGTTWWYRLVRAHPAVAHAKGARKELHFFDDRAAEPSGRDEADAYHRRFPRPPGSVVGEWTPRYMLEFWVPPRLHAAAPDARLLALLRDPIQRYVSGLAHDLARARPSTASLHDEHFARGLYHEQLQRFLASYPRESLLVLQYEQVVRDPEHHLRRTYEHLGIDPGFVPPDLRGRTNETSSEKPTLVDAQHGALVEGYRRDLAGLATDFPELDLALWPTARAAQ